MLNQRGSAPRNHRNALVFLAPDRQRIEDLKQLVRQYRAWKSIVEEHEELNLDAFQYRVAQKHVSDSLRSVQLLIPQAYIWLLVPDQPDRRIQSDDMKDVRLQPQPDQSEGLLAGVASSVLINAEELITTMAGEILKEQHMDEIPLWRGNHVSIKELKDDFARYVYLSRFKNSNVLLDAIHNGLQSTTWQRETFAYADGWDERTQRYINLQAGTQVAIIDSGLLVKPEVALAQMEADRRAKEAAEQQRQNFAYTPNQKHPDPAVFERGGSLPTNDTCPEVSPHETAPSRAVEPQYRRFHGSVQIDARRMGSAAGTIMEEVVKHLAGLNGAHVQVTLEIQADFPDEVPDYVIRTVTENCHTLKFDHSSGFEEE
jgi:uncharacterized protein